MKIREQVQAFHKAAESIDPKTPTIPSDDVIRLRFKLIKEEFFEALESVFLDKIKLNDVSNQLNDLLTNDGIKVDMIELMDAFGDIDYVVEGGRLVFGVDGEPIADEIQRSNMDKFRDGIKRRADGKILKPEGWTAPDIKTILANQGWK